MRNGLSRWWLGRIGGMAVERVHGARQNAEDEKSDHVGQHSANGCFRCSVHQGDLQGNSGVKVDAGAFGSVKESLGPPVGVCTKAIWMPCPGVTLARWAELHRTEILRGLNQSLIEHLRRHATGGKRTFCFWLVGFSERRKITVRYLARHSAAIEFGPIMIL
ncbi:hypothetical protein RHE_CH02022 [Rhizobium etli CFN 42]|uniref:Uncharacterized protein n=1 Tax=Rhizobium etli (strain ATCC 51251 / DSM 11541 / JCM 21823 / NBRC 15573 / CFN 42) TaxID=347834 RepID=Q2K8N0_RHIEC|nr:hypothetical protein RHE_CH02022 [Rhizobium etli CFN 42]